ncbi:MAG: UDP-N-acetylmuramoyl-tripeptide--D-alanyl-D-alanine ligase [Chthoniobacterales bacterium]
MNPITLSRIAEMSGATLIAGDPLAQVLRVCKDTREIRPGDLYVALRGGNFDGNAFLAEAASKGAAGALCDDEPPTGLPSSFGILTTPDALAGMTLLAAAWRSQLTLRSVVVTGSSGKTSVKDMTAAVLRSMLRVTATKGNLNNHIGLPLSILDADPEDQAAVWEIGMNHRGEISPLAGLARPDIGIITGIGTAHIEHLGSREEIAREKGDLLEKVTASGFGIIPAHDDFAAELRGRTAGRVLAVGIGEGDLRAVDLKPGLEGSRFVIEGEFGRAEASLPVPGRHMVCNALLAVAAGVLCGIPLELCAAALERTELTGGRLTRLSRKGATILDDTYNANPESMVAALETLGAVPVNGRKVAVLGRMGELGPHAAAGYERVGRKAAKTVQTLICVGEEASAMAEAAKAAGHDDARTVADHAAAAEMLSGMIQPGDLVLLKASRSARLEQILQQLD